MSQSKHKKAIFLDRDGVINRKLPENRYVANQKEFELIPGVRAALKILSKLGYLLIVVTNQRGIARGLMDETQLNEVHRHMKTKLEERDILLDGIYFCPHDRDEGCNCRKPRPGMILEATTQFNIDLDQSFMVGDSDSDVAAAVSAGVRAIRISSEIDPQAYLTFPTLVDFAQYLDRLKDQPVETTCGDNNDQRTDQR
ncbi:MAG: D-glycero-beta-D-manno-heptose 1,7-bisphosphate 7-phosphatase [Syntrophaceae bacterium]|nr:D-glycero-beta-D-manno-heptose 1,7-bisphosphate 7-phosphatase [Syntrophaceae bacterium]